MLLTFVSCKANTDLNYTRDCVMVEIKVNRTVILPVVLYGNEFWTFTLR